MTKNISEHKTVDTKSASKMDLLPESKEKKEEDIFREIIETIIPDSLQKHYLTSRVVGQIIYMDTKSYNCKQKYLRSQMTSIVGGVIVTALVGLSTFVDDKTTDWRKFFGVTAFAVSQIVTVSNALEQLHKNNELWLFYRRTNEYMKSQLWHFLELTGPYENLDRNIAFKILVKQLEEIIPRDLDIISASSKGNNSQISGSDKNTESQDNSENPLKS